MGRDGRDNGFAAGRTFKGYEILSSNLATTSSLDVLLIATWNDLGEGTGINRWVSSRVPCALEPTGSWTVTQTQVCPSTALRPTPSRREGTGLAVVCPDASMHESMAVGCRAH